MKKLKKIKKNLNLSFQGIIPRAKGFVLSFEEAQTLIAKNPKNQECIKNFLIGKDINQGWTWRGSRMIIDFQDWPLEKAMEYKECFEIVKNKVKPQRLSNTSTTQDNHKARKNWWHFIRTRPEMRQQLKPLKQFIMISAISKYSLFVMVKNKTFLPGHGTFIITSSSFSFMGILSSKFHVVWAKYQGSSMKGDPRYTNTTCFETFPFPYHEKIT